MYVGEGSKREQSCLLSSWLAFSHFLCYPQSNWALLVLILRWVGLCMFWDPVGLSSELSCEAGSFSCCLNPHKFLSVRGFEALFPCDGTLGCVVCLAPQLFLPVYSHANVGPPGPPAATLFTLSSSCRLATSPLHPGCPSLPLLPVWMNVSSLTPWLSDFHTVQFSGSSGYFLFLNLLLSFFWLCKVAKCIYLCLHLVWKSIYI